MRNSTASWLAGGIAGLLTLGLGTVTVLASNGAGLAPAAPSGGPATPSAPVVVPSPVAPTPVVAPPVPAVTPTAVVTPLPPAAPRPKPRLANPTVPVRYPIPDGAALTASEVGDAFKLLSDEGDYPRTPTAMGQSCDPGNPRAKLPVSGRHWMWVQQRPGTFQDTLVEQVVTGWPDGATAFKQLTTQTGYCVFPSSVEKVASGTDLWVGSFASERLPYGVATHRVNNVLVSVTVTGPRDSSTDTVVAEARRLAAVAAQHVRDVGLQDR